MEEISTETIIASLPACFQVKDVTQLTVTGTVTSDDELNDTLESFERTCVQSFVICRDASRRERLLWKTVKDHGEKNYEIPGKIQWHKTQICSYGGKPKQTYSKNEQTTQNHEDHGYSNKRKACSKPSASKKIGCEAKVQAWKLILYRDFRMDSSKISKRAKAERMAELKAALQKGESCKETAVIHIILPLPAAHSGHTVTQHDSLGRRIDKKVLEKIQEYVHQGNSSISSIKQMLCQFVENDLCQHDTVKPAKSDRAFYPTRSCLRNHVRRALAKDRNLNTDQDSQQKVFLEWQEQVPSAKICFRKGGQPKETTAVDDSTAEVPHILRGKPQAQTTIPVQGMIGIRDDLSELLEMYWQDDSEPQNELPEGQNVRIENKRLNFDVESDQTGVYLRVSEIGDNFHSSITIPERKWAEFRDKLSQFVDKSNLKDTK